MIKLSDLIKTAIGGAFGLAIGNFAYRYPDWAAAREIILYQVFAIALVVAATVGVGWRKT